MKILIADDHRIMREGLRSILEQRDDFTVIGEASDGHEAVLLARERRPDVIVMDIGMPGLNGIDATRRVLAERPATKIVALSMNSDSRYVLAMLSAGASGYLLKNAAAEELARAIETVAGGSKYVSPLVADTVISSAIQEEGARPESAPLTAREREVLQLLAEGATSKEIALRLEVAISTVETHRRQIMNKVGLRSIAELTKFAIREGLTRLER